MLDTFVNRPRRRDSLHDQSQKKSFLVHFLGKPPSVLQIQDDPTAEHTLLEATCLELEPREVDKGWASYWEATTPESEENINAGFAARRPHKQKLLVLRVPKSTVVRSGIEIQAKADQEAFRCISDLHRLLDLSSKASRMQLATEIWNIIKSGESGLGKIHYSIKKKDIIPLVTSVYDRCSRDGFQPETHTASQWARDAFEKR